MNIGAIQIWTPETFPYATEEIGGSFLMEGKEYIIAQSEIDRIRNLTSKDEIIRQAEQIRQMIESGTMKLKEI